MTSPELEVGDMGTGVALFRGRGDEVHVGDGDER